jgi:hypothetical protein
LRPAGYAEARYLETERRVAGELAQAGYHVSLPPWSTVEEWTSRGRICIVDIDKADASRFICGNKEPYTKLKEHLGRAELDPELLFKQFLVKSCYRLRVERKQLGTQDEPHLKRMAGGMRWGVLVIAQAFKYFSPQSNRLYRSSEGPHDSSFIISSEAEDGGLQNDLAKISPMRAARIAGPTIDFLLWLREANFRYCGEQKIPPTDVLTHQAQVSIASNLCLPLDYLKTLLQRAQESVLETVRSLEMAIEADFALTSRDKAWWTTWWFPVRNELREAVHERRPVRQSIIDSLSETTDPVLRLLYLWYSEDADGLRRCVSALAVKPKFSAQDWPELAGLAANPHVPKDVHGVLAERLSGGYEWRGIKEAFQRSAA